MTSAARDSSLRRRVPTAMVYGAVVLGAIWGGFWPWFLAALTAGALLSYYELWRMFARRPYSPSLGVGLVLVVAFLLLHVTFASFRAAGLQAGSRVGTYVSAFDLGMVLAVALVAVGLLALRSRDLGSGLLSGVLTVAAALYCGWLLGYLIDLSVLPPAVLVGGPEADVYAGILARSWILLAIFPTWAADVAAYAVGSVAGRRKLAPRISPGKTVEGTLAGILAAVAVSVLIVLYVDFAPLAGIAIGLTVGVAGLAGDLVESAIKRAAEAKDSGGILPGHGGVLDRLDSLIFVAPCLALFFEIALRIS